MAILLIDLAEGSNICVYDKKLLAKLSSNGKNSDTVMEMIDNALKKAKKTIADVKEICLNIGPGSFTGLRVAISIAKGLGFQTDMKYRCFTSFDLFDKTNKIKVVKGFSKFVYICDGGYKDCAQIDNLDKTKKYVTYDKDTYNMLKNLELDISLEAKQDYAKVLDSKPVSIRELSPLYLRKSQAEIAREEKLKNAKQQ